MKSFLIVFTDPHLPYSPTVLNLFNELKKQGKVQIIAPEPERLFSLQKVDDPDILYFAYSHHVVDNPGIFKRIVNKIVRKIKPPTTLQIVRKQLENSRTIEIIKRVAAFDGEIIAIDFMALWCVQQAGKKAHLVSLEIHTNDHYRDHCSFEQIKSVLIQSEDRYHFLFKDIDLKRFYIQNSPLFLDFKPDITSRPVNELVFCGSAVPGFGIFSCLDFIMDNPEYKLTIKGAVPPSTRHSIERFYQQLVTDNRLIIDDSYMDADSLTRFISRFRIGFVFYDFYRFEHLRTFNYYTAPSGKMFQYFNSGVPVIGNKLQGLEIIEKSDAGVIIPYLSSVQIKSAIDKIESSYYNTAVNSKKVSEDYDFAKTVKGFISFLKSDI